MEHEFICRTKGCGNIIDRASRFTKCTACLYSSINARLEKTQTNKASKVIFFSTYDYFNRGRNHFRELWLDAND